MKKSTTMLDFFKRKYSNSSEVNVGLPTTNVDISIPENVDVPISQTQFQRVDLDSLDYDPRTRKQIWEYRFNQRDENWVFVLVDSLLILYGCVFEIFFLLISGPPNLKSWIRPCTVVMVDE